MRLLIALLLAFVAFMPATAQDTLPIGQLPDTARPTAYRLDLDIDPSRERFSGQVSIDVDVRRPSRLLYLHGRGLAVNRISARAGGREVRATWTQLNPVGLARVDFEAPVSGPITLDVAYDAPFSATDDGLYRSEVGGAHYAWTQMEPIEARSVFPSFDEPRFKTPFTVTIITPAGSRAVTNGADNESEPVGDRVRHRFATTAPIPTYLTAFAVGPFDVLEGVIPANEVRQTPLPQRIIATRGNLDRMRFALEETPRIVALLERYFGMPYPYSKLDQIASPLMGGAMENVGAIIYGDSILLVPDGAPVRQRQTFGMVVAHELSHQWFGNLVTPAWWEDNWLKESFANWMGYRIGAEWRPELNIQVGSINEALAAMNTDALAAGRPIRQPITDSGAIDASFDAITYGKGGQVVDMIEAYLGREIFQRGVQLHLRRFADSGTATADQFFESLSQAAGDPRLVRAMQGFVNQQGLPVVTFTRNGRSATAAQARYTPLGASAVPNTQWLVPLCLRQDGQRSCTLLDRPSAPVDLRGEGWFMPNAGGHGYYRFELPSSDWDRLISAGPSLTAGEALAATDSLWASFRAGGAPPEKLITAARSFARHSDSTVITDGGFRLAGLENSGLIEIEALPAYRQMLAGLYLPKLEAIGFNPGRGVHGEDPPDRQRLRGDLVGLLAGAARHPPTRATLRSAASSYLEGNEAALDLAFLGSALAVHVEDNGLQAAETLLTKAIESENTQFRTAAISALSGSGDPALSTWLQQQLGRPGLRANEIQLVAANLIARPETRDLGFAWLRANAVDMVRRYGAGALGRMIGMPAFYCDSARAGEVEALFRPLVEQTGRAGLSLDRTVERIRNCAALKARRSVEVTEAFR